MSYKQYCEGCIARGLLAYKCELCDGYTPVYKKKTIIWIRKGLIWYQWKE